MRAAVYPMLLALSLSCKPKLAPEPEYIEPVLTLETDGYYQDGNVEIEGQATGLSNLTVNGGPLAQDGNSYRQTLNLDRGVNVIEVRGEDMRGDTHYIRRGVLSGEYDQADQTVEEAVAVRINRGGLDKIGQLVSGLIVDDQIEATVQALNPLYEDSYGVFGISAVDISASLADLAFDPLQVQADPRPGVLELEIVIPNLSVTVNATGEVVVLDFDQDVTLAASRAVIRGDVMADVTSQGQLSLDLVNTTVELEDFSYDVSLLPSFVEGFLLVDTLRGIIENTLREQIETRVPQLIEDQLAGLDFSFETELLGRNVLVAATFANLYSDQDGLQLETHLDVYADAGTDKTAPGYLYASSTNLPHPPRNEDMGLSVSDNLLNNLLFQVWRSGLLDLDLDSARGDIEPILLSQLGATNAARVKVDARTPPVFVERNGRAQAQVTELLVRIETPDGTNGEYVDLAVTAYIDLELTVTDGVLALELGTPELVIDVRDSDWGIDDNTLADLLAAKLPIDTLLSLLGAFEFPIPELAGISIESANAERDASGVHTSIGATL